VNGIMGFLFQANGRTKDVGNAIDTESDVK
jgi:hypothetical protein